MSTFTGSPATTPQPASSPSSNPVRSARMSRRELLGHKLRSRIGRLTGWEFWPAWAVYTPLLPWLGWYALRSGHPLAATAINPAIPLGGLVGESKSQILSLFPPESVLSYALIAPGTPAQRLDAFHEFLFHTPATYPVILKPDVGERGTAVRLISDAGAAARYFHEQPGPVIIQRYHPGPCEVGVFYIRLPGEPSGRIFSVTAKRFPIVIGDGHSTLAELIWRHPRLRLQARTFLHRLGAGADAIPASGQPTRLAIAGNHCRGTMFLDAPHLATPQLAAAMDRICSHHPGICFGRFDIRCTSEQALASGHDINIVEFNGLLAESTNIYDPSFSFLRGQRVLREQWRLAFSGGASNIRMGTRPPRAIELLRALATHLGRPGATADSD
jgi:hypothetical protein